MSANVAWLLQFSVECHAAVAQFDVVHVMAGTSKRFFVPESPHYCDEVVVWDREVLPVMNLLARTHEAPHGDAQACRYLAVCRYLRSDSSSAHGALQLVDVPQRVVVDDADACELSARAALLRDFAVSCFEHAEHGPVPILNLDAVFAPRATS